METFQIDPFVNMDDAGIAVSACKKSDSSVVQNKGTAEIISSEIFDFNTVDYYWRLKDHAAEIEIYKEANSIEKGGDYDIFGSYEPVDIADSTFINRLEENGYNKSIIVHQQAITEIAASIVSGNF